MRIANPLYDHAFKYLMSNNRLAKKVLSVILDKEVVELEPRQQEIVVEDQQRQFTLYRLDFKALIRDETGRQETVLIELQKSKVPTNLLRFRNYLSSAYGGNNIKKNKASREELENPALPIISIYILGYNVEDIPVMAAKVDRKIIDASSNEELHIQSDFIDLLTHTCYVLQVRRLPANRRTRIEQFMTLFNQVWIEEESYILDLEDVPEEFKDIAEYLQRPLLETDLLRKLDEERILEDVFADYEADVRLFQAQAEQAQAQAEQAQAQAEQERQEKEAVYMKLQEAEAKAEQERIAKEISDARVQTAMQNYVQLLIQSGKTTSEIAQETGLAAEEVERLSKKAQ